MKGRILLKMGFIHYISLISDYAGVHFNLEQRLECREIDDSVRKCNNRVTIPGLQRKPNKARLYSGVYVCNTDFNALERFHVARCGARFVV